MTRTETTTYARGSVWSLDGESLGEAATEAEDRAYRHEAMTQFERLASEAGLDVTWVPLIGEVVGPAGQEVDPDVLSGLRERALDAAFRAALKEAT